MSTLLTIIDGSKILWFMLGAAVFAIPLVIIILRSPKKDSTLLFTIVTKSLSITASNIFMEVRRSQFTEAEGGLFVSGSIKPTTANGAPEEIDGGTAEYESSNEDVATVEEDPNDEKKFRVKWVAPGEVTISGKADGRVGEGTKIVTGFLHLTLLEDEADKLVMELDALPDPA